MGVCAVPQGHLDSGSQQHQRQSSASIPSLLLLLLTSQFAGGAGVGARLPANSEEEEEERCWLSKSGWLVNWLVEMEMPEMLEMKCLVVGSASASASAYHEEVTVD